MMRIASVSDSKYKTAQSLFGVVTLLVGSVCVLKHIQVRPNEVMESSSTVNARRRLESDLDISFGKIPDAPRRRSTECTGVTAIDDILASARLDIATDIAGPLSAYKWDDFCAAVRYINTVDGFQFFLGGDAQNTNEGLVNIAGFLSQAMVESGGEKDAGAFRYCDENKLLSIEKGHDTASCTQRYWDKDPYTNLWTEGVCGASSYEDFLDSQKKLTVTAKTGPTWLTDYDVEMEVTLTMEKAASDLDALKDEFCNHWLSKTGLEYEGSGSNWNAEGKCYTIPDGYPCPEKVSCTIAEADSSPTEEPTPAPTEVGECPVDHTMINGECSANSLRYPSTARCGAGWGDANSKCKATCTVNSDCEGGDTCAGGLSSDPCAPSPTAPPTASCSESHQYTIKLSALFGPTASGPTDKSAAEDSLTATRLQEIVDHLNTFDDHKVCKTSIDTSSMEGHVPKMQCSPTANPGCCWWGRGPIQITGPTNIWNFQQEVLSNIPDYSSTNLCNTPGDICEDTKIAWLSAMHFWVNGVQNEPTKYWEKSLQAYVENEFDLEQSKKGPDGQEVDISTGMGQLVNGGAWNAFGHDIEKRNKNFESLIDALKEGGMTYHPTATSAFPKESVGNPTMKCYDVTGSTACDWINSANDDDRRTSAKRCGDSAEHAKDSCHSACTEDSDCQQTLKCFGGLSSDECADLPFGDSRIGSTTRCGESWGHAEFSCFAECSTDEDCLAAGDGGCYADLTTDCDGKGYSRCGYSYGEANTHCGSDCEHDRDCLKCDFDDECSMDCPDHHTLMCLAPDAVPDVAVVFGKGSSPQKYCVCHKNDCPDGEHLNASGVCEANVCTCSDGTAASGEECRSDGHEICSECDDNYTLIQSKCEANSARVGSDTRCGLGWVDAETKCGAQCASTADCLDHTLEVQMSCYGGLSDSACTA